MAFSNGGRKIGRPEKTESSWLVPCFGSSCFSLRTPFCFYLHSHLAAHVSVRVASRIKLETLWKKDDIILQSNLSTTALLAFAKVLNGCALANLARGPLTYVFDLEIAFCPLSHSSAALAQYNAHRTRKSMSAYRISRLCLNRCQPKLIFVASPLPAEMKR